MLSKVLHTLKGSDTFGCGIVDEKGRILANEKDVFRTEKGGLIPRQLSEHHSNVAKKVLVQALEKAGVKLKEVDLIAFSQGPGIGQALRVGAVAARSLSLIHNKPLLGVNHCIAHIEIGRKKCRYRDPLTLYASGANTQVIGFESGRYRVYGETLDIGLGNLLDSFGRRLGLGFPAGPKMDEMYLKGKKILELPYSVKGMDLVFSGLLTAAEQKIGRFGENDLVYSLMQTAFAMVTEVTERALAHTEKKELLLAGGVCASPVLREMLQEMCSERGVKVFTPERSLLVDNAAMIGWLGLLEFQHGQRMTLKESVIKPKQRTDEVEVNWI